MTGPSKEKRPKPNVNKQVESVDDQPHEDKGMLIDAPPYTYVDMMTVFSQITIKVPLSEMFRIEEHRNKVVTWLGGIGMHSIHGNNSPLKDSAHNIPKKIEDEQGVVSQIPIYLDNSAIVYIENIDPFFLSLIIDGKTMKNYMIDNGSSNIGMPFKFMESLGLKLDTNQGRCCALDSRQVLVIGTISAFPYKLDAYPENDLTMSVLVVDIPPQYGILLSRKRSISMGGSPQCDL